MTEEERDNLTAGIRWAIVHKMSGSKNSKAARLGVSVHTIDKWTSGSSRPSDTNMARLARVTDTDQETIKQGGYPALETEAS